jgi:hypothetical protein
VLAIRAAPVNLARFVESEPSGHAVFHVLIANPKAPYPTLRRLFFIRARSTNSRCRRNPSRSGLRVDPIFALLQSEAYCFALHPENVG